MFGGGAKNISLLPPPSAKSLVVLVRKSENLSFLAQILVELSQKTIRGGGQFYPPPRDK